MITTKMRSIAALTTLFIVCFALAQPDNLYGAIIPSDRMISWNPGIPGGVPPRTTICANVKNAPYNAVGDDSTDDTAAIQNAINACPAGQVVYIPTGIYKTTAELFVNKGIVLRGDGPYNTKIRLYSSANNIITLGNSTTTTTTASIASGYTKGSATITISDSTPFSVGNYILVDQLNDPNIVQVGDCTWCSRSSGTRALGQIVKITAKNSNTLTIDPPLYFTYSSSYSPEVVKVSNNMVEYAGIENLYVERVTAGGQNNINLRYCAYCWVKNVESYNAMERHVIVNKSYKCEVRDSFIHHGHDYQGGQSYGVSLFDHTTATRVENNIFYHLRHSMVLEGGPAGNVFGYNYSSDTYGYVGTPPNNWLYTDMITHGAYPHMNLFEGNIAVRATMDNVHGNAGYTTFFRNHIVRESNPPEEPINKALRVMELQAGNLNMNIVGNVLGKPGQNWTAYEDDGTRTADGKYIYNWGYRSDGATTSSEPTLKNTVLPHGNYDYFNQFTVWDSSIPDHSLPNSYYLTSKPSFYGSLPWPSIGPDLSPMVGSLPAERRFHGPRPPSQLRVQ